jgi:hypothetical protein
VELSGEVELTRAVELSTTGLELSGRVDLATGGLSEGISGGTTGSSPGSRGGEPLELSRGPGGLRPERGVDLATGSTSGGGGGGGGGGGDDLTTAACLLS